MALLYVEIDGAVFSLPSASVVEVIPIGFVTPVPTAPPAVRGLIQTRGRVVPVIDLSSTPARPIRPGAPLVVVEAGAERLRAALLVELLHDTPPDEERAAGRPVTPLDVAAALGDLRRRIEGR